MNLSRLPACFCTPKFGRHQAYHSRWAFVREPAHLGRLGRFVAILAWLTVTCGLAAQDPVQLLTPRLSSPEGGSGDSGQPSFNADGRWVYFVSSAQNLVTNDDHQPWLDIFARDITDQTTRLISVNRAGVGGGDGNSVAPLGSADGRYVVFLSEASDLTEHALIGHIPNVFLRDLQSGSTRLVSVNRDGDGGADRPCENVQMSRDGRYILFESAASNLVSGDGNKANDIFLRDMASGSTSVVNVDRFGKPSGALPSGSASLSADGSRILFLSRSPHLVEGGWRWRIVGEGDPPRPVRARLFEPMTNRSAQVYLRDLRATNTTWISSRQSDLFYGDDGEDLACSRPVLSPDGAVAFYSMNDSVVVRCEVDRVAERDAWLARALDSVGSSPVGFVIVGPLVMHPDLQVIGLECMTPTIPPSRGELSKVRHLYFVNFSQLESCPGGGGGFGQGGLGCPSLTLVSPGFPGRPNVLDGRSTSLRFSADGQHYYYATDSPRFNPKLQQDGGMALVRVAFPNGMGRPVPDRSDLQVFEPDLLEGFELSPRSGVLAFASRRGLGPRSEPEPWVNVHLFDVTADRSELVSARHPERGDRASGEGLLLTSSSISSGGETFLVRRADSGACCGDANQLPDLFLVEHSVDWSPLFLPVTPFVRPRVGQIQFRQPPQITNRNPIAAVLHDGGRYVFYLSAPLPVPRSTASGALLRYDRASGQDEVVLAETAFADPLPIDPSSLLVDSSGDTLVYSSGPVSGQRNPLRSNLYRVKRFKPVGSKPATWTTTPLNGRVYGTLPDAGNRLGDVAITSDGKWVVFLNSDPLEPEVRADSRKGLRLYARELETGRLIVPPSSRFSVLKGVEVLNFQLSTNDTDVVFHTSIGEGFRFNFRSQALDNICSACENLSVDGQGRWVTYERPPGEESPFRQVMLQDLESGDTRRVSLRRGSADWGNGSSSEPRVTPDGKFVVFVSRAEDLVAGDLNRSVDVFLHDVAVGSTRLLSVNRHGTGSGQGLSAQPVVSRDGSVVVFRSSAPDLVESDYDSEIDEFVAILQSRDADHDGILDAWERRVFGSLDRDGRGDKDGDGTSDYEEFLSGTNPTSKTSVFRQIGIGLGTPFGQEVLWTAVPGRYYQLQHSTDPTSGDWKNAGEPVLAHAATWFAYDVEITAETDRKFYRVIALSTSPR